MHLRPWSRDGDRLREGGRRGKEERKKPEGREGGKNSGAGGLRKALTRRMGSRTNSMEGYCMIGVRPPVQEGETTGDRATENGPKNSQSGRSQRPRSTIRPPVLLAGETPSLHFRHQQLIIPLASPRQQLDSFTYHYPIRTTHHQTTSNPDHPSNRPFYPSFPFIQSLTSTSCLKLNPNVSLPSLMTISSSSSTTRDRESCSPGQPCPSFPVSSPSLSIQAFTPKRRRTNAIVEEGYRLCSGSYA